MLGDGHVRCGGRAGGTGQERPGTAPRSDPYTRLAGPARWTWYYL
jgi:hypothetical protein